MNLFELFAVLTLNKSGYEKGLNDAEKSTKSFSQKVKDTLQNETVQSFTMVIGSVVKLGKELYNLMNVGIEYADQMGDLAAKYGTTSEAISEIGYIATQTGSDVNTLTSAMSMLYMRAKQDGEAFQSLGVSVKDSNGQFKSMDELFWETVYAMNNLESDGEKSAYMLDLFGRSAANIGEILRKDTAEIDAMRNEAHDLGIVVSQETADFAGAWQDRMDRIKLQGQSALASLVAGAPDAEEKLSKFFYAVLDMLENVMPTFVNFSIRLLLQVSLALIKLAPELVVNFLDAVIKTIFETNWLQVGLDVGKSILQGVLNVIVSGLNSVFGWLGLKIPKVDLGVGKNGSYFENIDTEKKYSLNNKNEQVIDIKIEASGDNEVSAATAEKTAEALAPYIDKILGGK